MDLELTASRVTEIYERRRQAKGQVRRSGYQLANRLAARPGCHRGRCFAQNLLFLPGSHGFETLIVGVYQKKRLNYVAKVRNGFVAGTRDEIFRRLGKRQAPQCPFANLPQKNTSRWGEALTAEKMKECRWIHPDLVCQVAFVEWTDSGHLRHCKFVAMREDKRARMVVRET